LARGLKVKDPTLPKLTTTSLPEDVTVVLRLTENNGATFQCRLPWTDVIILKNIFAEKFGENMYWRFLLKLLLLFAKI
jgi:hypothetical protein